VVLLQLYTPFYNFQKGVLFLTQTQACSRTIHTSTVIYTIYIVYIVCVYQAHLHAKPLTWYGITQACLVIQYESRGMETLRAPTLQPVPSVSHLCLTEDLH